MNLVLGLACYSQNNIYPSFKIKHELARNSLVFLSVEVPARESLGVRSGHLKVTPAKSRVSGVLETYEEAKRLDLERRMLRDDIRRHSDRERRSWDRETAVGRHPQSDEAFRHKTLRCGKPVAPGNITMQSYQSPLYFIHTCGFLSLWFLLTQLLLSCGVDTTHRTRKAVKAFYTNASNSNRR